VAKLTRRFTAEQLRRSDELFDNEPGYAAMRDAIVSYAREQQGLTLHYWTLAKGPWFGQSVSFNAEARAARLGLPVSEQAKVIEQTIEAVRPRLAANRDFMNLAQRPRKRDSR
jgi:hypothetical protein